MIIFPLSCCFAKA